MLIWLARYHNRQQVFSLRFASRAKGANTIGSTKYLSASDLNSTLIYLTGVNESVSSPGSYQSQFSISPSSDGLQVITVGLQAPYYRT